MTTFSLDPDLQLRVGEHRVRLTPIEARAFSYLLEHLGTVVPREVLEQEVWGLRPGVKTEAVPVALRVLRKKLGPHNDLLETVRSVGWRLHPPARALVLEPLVDAATIERFRQNVDHLVDGLNEVEDADIDRVCVYLVECARLVVPSEIDRVLRALTRRAPNRLVVRLLTAAVTHDDAAITEGARHADPATRLLAMNARLATNPALLKPTWMQTLENDLDGPARLEVAGVRLMTRVNEGDPGAFEDVDELLAEARRNPVVHLRLLYRFGGALWRKGEVRRAAFLLQAAIEEGTALGLSVLRTRRLLAFCRVHVGPLDVEELLSVGDLLEADGHPADAALTRGYAAWMLAGAGRFDEMAGLLEGRVAPPTFRAVVEQLRLVLAARDGDAAAARVVEACEAHRFMDLGQEPQFSRFLAQWLRLLIRAALGEEQAWSDIGDLSGPDDLEVRTLQRLARERAVQGPFGYPSR